MINEINELFSTREIATIIWLLIFIFILIYLSVTREAVLNLFKQLIKLFKHPITIIIILVFILMVYLSTLFNFFSISFFKDYFIWYFFVFFSSIGLISSKLFTIKLSQIFFGTIKLSIIPYFIINRYTFDLWIELIILPILVIISMALAISETDNKFKLVNIILNIILSIVGFVILFNAIKQFSANISDIRQSEFWFSLSLEVILIFIHIPFLYLFKVLLMYEKVVRKIIFVLSKNKLINLKLNNLRVTLIVFKRCMFNKEKLYYLQKHAFIVKDISNYRELNNNIKVLIKENVKNNFIE